MASWRRRACFKWAAGLAPCFRVRCKQAKLRELPLLWLDSTAELYEWKQIEAGRAGDGGRLAHDRSDAGASGSVW